MKTFSLLRRATIGVAIGFSTNSIAQIIGAGYELTYGALPLTPVAGPNLIQNGSFETHSNFSTWLATASAADKALMRGPKNGQDNNAYVAEWAFRYGNWASTIGHAGLPDGWKTASNGGAANNVSGGTVLLPGVNQPGTYSYSGTPNGVPTGTITNPDLHARWTQFDTDGQGQVNSLPRPTFLGKSSMYFGTGATMYGIDGADADTNPDTFVSSFGTPNSRGIYALNPVPGTPSTYGTLTGQLASDTSFVRDGRLMTGGGGSAPVVPSGTVSWNRNDPVSSTSLFQDLTSLTAGSTYRLSFWAATENSEGAALGYNIDSGLFKVTVSDTAGTNPQRIFLENPGATDANRGRFYFIVFTATSGNMRIRFDDYGHLDTTPTDGTFGVDSTAELVLDGVELRQVPEAGTWAAIGFIAAGAVLKTLRMSRPTPRTESTRLSTGLKPVSESSRKLPFSAGPAPAQA